MNISQVPPGFRFHPTDEELVDYYLRKKVASRRIDLDVIKEIDLYKIEPWDLQEKCNIGTDQEQNEWYFFSHKDKKYPTGTRTNRATTAGFWKATGRDKAIYSKHNLIGMRKTLVFYKGRAPNGQKSDWIMHEYRLETSESGTPQEEGWVVCRAFKKRIAVVHKVNDHGSPCWYTDQVSFMPDMDSTKTISTLQPHNIDAVYAHYNPSSNSCKQELETQIYQMPHELLLHLPHLESPKLPTSSSTICNSISVFNASYGHHDNNAGDRSFLAGTSLAPDEHVQQEHQTQMNSIYEVNNDNFYGSNSDQVANDQVTDWRVLHKYVASQLSPGDAPKETFYSDGAKSSSQVSIDHFNLLIRHDKGLTISDYPAPSTSSPESQSVLWK